MDRWLVHVWWRGGWWLMGEVEAYCLGDAIWHASWLKGVKQLMDTGRVGYEQISVRPTLGWA